MLTVSMMKRGMTMGKGLFITGIDTDIGKICVTLLLVRTLRNAGYYKAAVELCRAFVEGVLGS